MAGMNSVVIQGRCGGAHMEQPRYMAPMKSSHGVFGATVEIRRQMEKKKETGEMQVDGQQVDKFEDGA